MITRVTVTQNMGNLWSGLEPENTDYNRSESNYIEQVFHALTTAFPDADVHVIPQNAVGPDSKPSVWRSSAKEEDDGTEYEDALETIQDIIGQVFDSAEWHAEIDA